MVALGDSITDGSFSTPDTNQRWPDLLCRPAERLLGPAPGCSTRASPATGSPPGPDQPLRPGPPRTGRAFPAGGEDPDPLRGHQRPRRGERRAGHRRDDEIADRAHRRGMRVVAATITPYKDFTWGGWSEETEARRQQVNAFVRDSGGVFDDYADFDKAVRDPDGPAAARRGLRLRRPSASQRRRHEGLRRLHRPRRARPRPRVFLRRTHVWTARTPAGAPAGTPKIRGPGHSPGGHPGSPAPRRPRPRPRPRPSSRRGRVPGRPRSTPRTTRAPRR